MSVPSERQSVKLSPKEVLGFQCTIWRYYETNGRHDLPWRLTDDPYRILVSEVMLQQTQVPRVLIKYPQFLNTFPDVQSLAKASLSDVLSVWQGMGYNRRAKFLQRAAQDIMERFQGSVPCDPVELISLPGIGKHTAGSIAAFAFNAPTVFIETNIRRTFIHHFFVGKVNVRDDDLYPFIQATLPKGLARDWYNALMDYGTYLAKNFPNPNHKSKHYKKQSPFETSLRKVRGEILKSLNRSGGSLSKQALAELPFEKERLGKALEALIKEGFVVKNKGGYRIA